MTSGKVSEQVARVEAELQAIWAPPDPESGETAKVRASMMNLVVVTIASDLDACATAVDDLAQTHPGRGFLLTLDGRVAPWDIDASVSAVCRSDGGSAPICSDRVNIVFGAMAAERAASVVASLSMSDLPTVLELAKGGPFSLAERLAPSADRVVVDSAHTSLARVARLARATRGSVADRAWVRAFSFRELCARFFDDEPETARSIDQVTIARTHGEADPAPLFIGWLASRLGWTMEAPDRARRPDGESVAISVEDDPRVDAGQAELCAVRLRTRASGERLDLACERLENPRIARSTKRGAREATHEHPLGFRDETWVAIKALDATEGDAAYREALYAGASWAAMRDARSAS